MANNQLMDKIVALCKRRGFIFPGSEIYGGLANSFDYGPLGTELKNNIKNLWWKTFVHQRDDMTSIDAAIIMSSKVWEASGHLKEFSDLLIECKNCRQRFRFDQMNDPKKCPNCGGKCSGPKQFNLMLKTFFGPTEDSSSQVYLRGEIAQAMFVNFKNILDTTQSKLPFGIASLGKAFRNEITPGNFIFRMREFNLMELEYFVKAEEWETYFEYWRKEIGNWIKLIGIDSKKIHEHEIEKNNLAHYSKKTIDFEFDYPFGRKELYGLAYRADFDLKNHYQEPPYQDYQTGKKFYPHVIEPTFGLDRTLLVILLSAYHQDGDRIVLKLKPKLAPFKIAVFPLLKNKSDLVEKARKIYINLKRYFVADFDDRGNIGKRYYYQDEIGTPFCITVDFETLKNNTVTVRYRDTTKQERIPVENLPLFLNKQFND